MSIFGVDISGIVAQTFKGNLNTGSLLKMTYDERDDTNLTAPSQSLKNFPFDGIMEKYSDKVVNGTSIMTGDRHILIIAGSLPAGIIPEVSDQITMGGQTYTLVDVDIDPAAATYTCQGRR